MESRDSFIFYRSILESGQALNPEDRLKFYEAIMQFSMDFKEPQLDGIVGAMFCLLRPTLDKSNKGYIAGKKASHPKHPARVTPRDTPNNKDKDKDKDKVKEIIADLNRVGKSKYKASTQSTSSAIKARLAEGYTVDDFKKVHLVKFAEWDGSDMIKHFNPGTLYRPGNFEKYANQIIELKQVGGVTW